MRPRAIRCMGITKHFGSLKAVHQVDLVVDHGELLVLLGPSGCGKTTLLRVIAGFEELDRGALSVGGEFMAGPKYHLPPDKRKVGMVFQEYALFPHMDVGSNVGYGLARNPDKIAQVKEMLAIVGLEGMENRMPHELSGGEQQRVALARALAPRPNVVLLDEPFSNLDEWMRHRIRADVHQILREVGATAIFVTHNQEEAMLLGDRVAVMNKGQLEQVDTPENIYHRPATQFVAKFMEVADFLPAQSDGYLLITELGILPGPLGLYPGEEVEIMLRPNDVAITSDETGSGIIINRAFQGANYLYTVQLHTGQVMHSEHQHNASYPVGLKVKVSISQSRELLCFVRGELRTIPMRENEQ